MQQPCDRGQKFRNTVCCFTIICKDEGFQPCRVNNGNDTCSPCPPGQYLNGEYSTANFDRQPCAEKQECTPEQIRDANGYCVCDRANQYINQGFDDDNCKLVDHACQIPGYELDDYGNCSPCKDGYFKSSRTNAICIKKRDISCGQNETISQGTTKTDRSCIPKESFTSIPLTTTTPSQVENSNTASIVLAVVVPVLLLLLALVIFWVGKKYVVKKRKQNKKAAEPADEAEEDGMGQRLTENTDPESGDTIKEDDVNYISGPWSINQKQKAEPFGDDDIPLNAIDDDESRGGNMPAGAEGGVNNDETNLKQSYSTNGEVPRSTGQEVAQHFPDSTRGAAIHDSLESPANHVAVVRPQVHVSRRAEPVPDYHILNEQPVRDDTGRLLATGPRSYSMPLRDNNGYAVPNGMPAVNALPDGSTSRVVNDPQSDSFHAVNPSY